MSVATYCPQWRAGLWALFFVVLWATGPRTTSSARARSDRAFGRSCSRSRARAPDYVRSRRSGPSLTLRGRRACSLLVPLFVVSLVPHAALGSTLLRARAGSACVRPARSGKAVPGVVPRHPDRQETGASRRQIIGRPARAAVGVRRRLQGRTAEPSSWRASTSRAASPMPKPLACRFRAAGRNRTRGWR